MQRHPRTFQFNAIIMTISALLLALPLPLPASNFFPAASIFCLSLGTLEEDGYLVMLGYFLFLVAVSYFTAIAFLPYLGFHLSTLLG